jgi:hypothetical protein
MLAVSKTQDCPCNALASMLRSPSSAAYSHFFPGSARTASAKMIERLTMSVARIAMFWA